MAQQFDSTKRLREMLKRELEIEQEERATVKQGAKLDKNITTCMEAIKRQQCEFETLNAILRQRREDLDTRTQLTQAVRAQLTAAKQANADIQAKLAKSKQEHNELVGCIRTMSEATNTYINHKELPERVKGVTFLRDEGRWMPFNYAADDTKSLNTLWTKLHMRSNNANKWHQLITMSGSTNDKENAKVTMPPIIEIDLTSPPSHR